MAFASCDTACVQVASRKEGVISKRFIADPCFEGCSKMPLPSPMRLRAGRQMQVELCEIPFAGAPEILRSEAYTDVRCNDEGPARRQGKRRRWAFLSNPT